MKDKFEAMF